MIVDTDTGTCRPIVNQNAHHGHGMCQPLSALGTEAIDGFVVGGVGRRALERLRASGIQVFQAEHATVGETLAAFKAGTLRLVPPDAACVGRHGHEHSPGHRRGYGRGGRVRTNLD
jgi:predicted Fe-Mo cluster-binding NifX family protein